jgi:excinuclease UvrABC nuclease subunit
MPVYGEDGSIVGTTRTSAHQLASLTVVQLDRLADALRAEMADAAAGLDFELAAGLRDELAAVTAERTRR